jgi:hypothetical protein
MPGWQRRVYKLDANHKWKAPPGYNIFVADRGLFRFNIPSGWDVEPSSASVKIRDRKPPDDECTLEVSVFRMPPIDWTGLPLPFLLQEVLKGDDREGSSRGEVLDVSRGDLELAWTETRFVEGLDLRPARARSCLARRVTARQTVALLITFAYWLSDADQFTPAWDELLRSLRLGEPVLGLSG